MIKLNDDLAFVKKIRRAIKKNDGYCPCSIKKTEETKCPCKDFREKVSGSCHCGLFQKFSD